MSLLQTATIAAVTDSVPLLNKRRWSQAAGLKMEANAGLEFNFVVTNKVRQHHKLLASPQILNAFAALRPCSRVVVNPMGQPWAELKKQFEERSSDLGAFAIPDLGPVRDGRAGYQTLWQVGAGECEQLIEGQTLTAVIFDPNRPVGFARIHAELTHPAAGNHAQIYELAFDIDMVYVEPARRGQGFGIDLSVAGSAMVADLMRAVYTFLPDRSTLAPVVRADYASDGGKNFVREIADTLKSEVTVYKMSSPRRKVRVQRLQIDAGE